MKQILTLSLVLCVASFVLAQDQQQQPKVVHFKKLQPFLPTLSVEGFTRLKPTGTTSKAMGYSVSEAGVQYEKATDSITYSIVIKIVDMSLMPAATWAMMYQQMDFENETEDGYEKTVEIMPGMKGIEKANTGDDKSCSLNFAVSNRFHVAMDANGFDDTKTLYALVKSMNLDKLSKLTAE